MMDDGKRTKGPRVSVSIRNRTDPVSVAIDLARRINRLNYEKPLPRSKEQYRYRGVKSAIKNGRVGNKAWSLSMNMKKLAKWRWKPWAMRPTRQERGRP